MVGRLGAASRSFEPLLLLSGYLGRAFTQIVILWVFAREAGPVGTGEFAFALAVSAPVFVFFEMALRNVYQTLRDPPSFRLFFVIRLVGATLAGSFVLALSAIVANFPPPQILLPILGMKVADSVLDICLARFQVLRRIATAAGYIWTNTALTLAAIFGTIVADSGATSAIVASALASTVVAAAAVVRVLPGSESVIGAAGDQMRRIARAGIALGSAQALTSLLVYLPTLYLTRGATTEAVGVFAVCSYSVTLWNLFFNSAMQTWLSRLRHAYVTDGRVGLEERWRSAAAYVIGVGLVGGALTLLLLPATVELVFGGEFAVSIRVVLPLALTIAVMGVEYSTASLLLVLNLYGSRLAGGLIGLFAALAFASATVGDADLALAGYVGLVGATARCLFSLAQLFRNRVPRSAYELATVE